MATIQAERISLPQGMAGTDETVRAMSDVAMGTYGAGSVKIRNLALDTIRTAKVAERDQYNEVVAIHEWVKRHLRYVRDPFGTELITHPETLAFDRTDGDCDDHVVLEAAMLGSLGIPTNFIVVGFKGQGPSHVYMQATVRDANGKSEVIPLDPIVKKQPAGWEAPNPTLKKVYPVNVPGGFHLAHPLRDTITAIVLVYTGYRVLKRWCACSR